MVFLIPKTESFILQALPTLAIEGKRGVNGFYMGHTNWAHLYNTNLPIFYYVKLLMIGLGYSDEQ